MRNPVIQMVRDYRYFLLYLELKIWNQHEICGKMIYNMTIFIIADISEPATTTLIRSTLDKFWSNKNKPNYNTKSFYLSILLEQGSNNTV